MPTADEQDDADDPRGDVAGDAHADEAVGEDEGDDAAEHGAPDGALAAGKRDPAQDDGGQGLEFPEVAGRRIRAVLARGIEDAADRAEHARQRIGEEQHALDRNAGVARRLAAGADGGQMPAVARAAEKDVPDDQHDNQRRGIDGNAEHIAFAEEVPGIAVDRVGGEDGGEFLVQDVDRGAQDDQRHQRGEKRTRLEIADQQAVDAADRRADRHRAEDDQRNRQLGAR